MEEEMKDWRDWRKCSYCGSTEKHPTSECTGGIVPYNKYH